MIFRAVRALVAESVLKYFCATLRRQGSALSGEAVPAGRAARRSKNVALARSVAVSRCLTGRLDTGTPPVFDAHGCFLTGCRAILAESDIPYSYGKPLLAEGLSYYLKAVGSYCTGYGLSRRAGRRIDG